MRQRGKMKRQNSVKDKDQLMSAFTKEATCSLYISPTGSSSESMYTLFLRTAVIAFFERI